MAFKQGLQVLALGVLSTVLTAIPTLAAQRISTFYGPIELSVSLASLETYAESGKLSDELAFYAQHLDPQDLEALRHLLNQQLPLSSVALAQILYSSMGESALEYVGKLVQTESYQNGFYAIRAALIGAAADQQGLTLLNALKQFPSDTIRINFGLIQQTAAAFQELSTQTDRVSSLIEQQSSRAAATESLPRTVDPPDLQTPGPWAWQMETLTLFDRQRDRRLIVDLYRPQVSQPAPVLMISPGLGASRREFIYLAQYLAAQGFAVAVLDHPGSDRQQLQNLRRGAAGEVAQPSEFIDRPLDVSFLLDQLEQSERQQPAEQRRLNLQQVGLLGHSFGGYTALALAGAGFNLPQLRSQCQEEAITASLANPSLLLQCAAVDLPVEAIARLADPRIRAIFIFNPIGNGIFGPHGLSQIQIPVLILGGSNDAIAPAILEQICPFTWLTVPDKYLVLIQGGTHIYTTQRQDLPLPAAFASPDPLLARSYLKVLSLAFAKTYIAAQPEYQPYLTASYAQTISQSPLQLSLVQPSTATELSQSCSEFAHNP